MKGDKAEIKGPASTLSQDKLPKDKFDYMISNPPYGRKWESDKDAILKKAELGFDWRFGAGTPRINDRQLLFLQHMINKMKTNERSRIAVINGSPLFTGDAGSGESNIRKWIIENDYLEAIVGLPEQLFYNTGIKTEKGKGKYN
jgi:type I restriction enzyme M protein